MQSPYATGRPADIDLTELDRVATHQDAARIVEQMHADLLAHPDEWENPTLERFLEALAAVLDALPNAYINSGEQFPDPPTWKLFTQALVWASGYE